MDERHDPGKMRTLSARARFTSFKDGRYSERNNNRPRDKFVRRAKEEALLSEKREGQQLKALL